MIHAMDEKVVSITPPGAIVDDTTFSTAALDTRGYARATIYVVLGATDVAMAALKLRESDDDSAYSDVPGLDFSSDGELPGASDDDGIFAFDIDLRGRKRYLDVVATADDGAAGTYAIVFARLTRPSQSPGGAAADRGLVAALSA